MKTGRTPLGNKRWGGRHLDDSILTHGVHLTHNAFNTAPLRYLDPETVYNRECSAPIADLTSRALYGYGAEKVRQSDFWMLRGKGAKFPFGEFELRRLQFG